ncbi:leucine-rich repeat domain-containing protein [uncultured Treponema sp.]|uniref:leucine-rich repeat domain-containing protein n=1 Tax=uncultured Treponema sp. TaxID=162155 RepID=UPI0025EC5ABB|nr:leucine-rich repeat domain-containing protein [uncultured Treponema sp.]
MKFENSDFIIKTFTDKKTHTEKHVLRRYKGHESVVTIPDGVTKIADLTFGDDIEPNETITKIIIPDSVTEITKYAFRYCMSLKEIEFPKNLKRFDINFAGCPSLEEVTVPESVECIGNLLYSKTLKTIHLGTNITKIDFQSYWKNDKKISNLSKNRVINLFRSNPAYELTENGFLINKVHKTTLLTADKIASEIHVPEGIEVISANTFCEFDSVFALTDKERMPLKKVYIPGSVKEIRNFAFLNCNTLEDVIYDGLSTELKVCEGAFFLCRNFQKEGTDIICKDRAKKKSKARNKGWDPVRRIIIIDKMIRQKRCYNLEAVKDEWCRLIGSDEPSDASLNRSLKDMREDFKAIGILQYKKPVGYYYNQPFILDFESLIE